MRNLLSAFALLMALVPASAHAHAALLQSSPKAGSVLTGSPSQIRLLFSEEIVSDLCRISISGPGNFQQDLRVASDPQDAHAIIAPLSALAPGIYRVTWRVVSTDGHPVAGKLGFSVLASAGVQATLPSFSQPTRPAVHTAIPTTSRLPVIASLLRGIGVAALAALVGLLGFAITSRPGALVNPTRLSIGLAIIASIALAFHLLAWGNYVAPGAIRAAAWRTILLSNPGKLESLRVILTVLALLTLVVLRRRAAAFYVGAAGLLTTAAIGHSGSITPLLSVPLLAVHLTAISAWLGGLAWLRLCALGGPANVRDQAIRVSRTAFIAAITVGATGIVQSLLLLQRVGDLVSTSYGKILLWKIGGWIVLLCFGWYHRYRALPALSRNEAPDMSATLRYEMTVMTAVIIVAAFLSYAPLPQ